MKKCVLPALLLALLLTGCGGTEAKELSDTALEEAPRPLTQSEVRSAYDRAVTAYGWFDLSPLPCGQEQEMVDGWIYQKVDYPGIEDLADLRAYLRVVFSPDLTERLLTQGQRPAYRDVDGALYAAAGVGREKESDKGSVEVTVELLDSSRSTVIGVESYAFPYEFVEGSWAFTDFQMVY